MTFTPFLFFCFNVEQLVRYLYSIIEPDELLLIQLRKNINFVVYFFNYEKTLTEIKGDLTEYRYKTSNN